MEELIYNINSKQFSPQSLDYDIFSYSNTLSSEINLTNLFVSLKSESDIDFNLFYKKHEIPKKSGGTRLIYEPFPILKQLQSFLLKKLYLIEDEKSSVNLKPLAGVTAYRPLFSVVDNANFHINQDLVIKLDIENFFPSISYSVIIEIWKKYITMYPSDLFINKFALDEEIDFAAAKCAKLTTLNGFLPQGAPTSGYLANLVLNKVDKKIVSYCYNNKFRYSRYCDDITISGSNELKSKKNEVIKIVRKALEKESFAVNDKKTRVLFKNKRQLITGIVTNERRSIQRSIKKNIRQELFFLKKFAEGHYERLKVSERAYLHELLGKVTWCLHVESDNKEFRRYKYELLFIIKYVEKYSIDGTKMAIQKLNELALPISSILHTNNGYIIENKLEWKNVNEINQPHLISSHKFKSKQTKRLFDIEELSKILALEAKDGWRLPTIKEFSELIEKTAYMDKKNTGKFDAILKNHSGAWDDELISKFPPGFLNLDGYVDPFTFVEYRQYLKTGFYWTSDLLYNKKAFDSRSRVVHGIFVIHSSQSNKVEYFNNYVLKHNNICNKLDKNIGFLKVDANDGKLIKGINKKFKFSVRLVRDIENVQLNRCPFLPSETFFSDMSSLELTVNFAHKGIDHLPEWFWNGYHSKYLIFNDNNFQSIPDLSDKDLIKIDFSNNKLEYFDFNKINKATKHIYLHGNKDVMLKSVNVRNILKNMHEFTAPCNEFKKFTKDIKSEDAFSFVNDCDYILIITNSGDISEAILNPNDVKAIRLIVLSDGSNHEFIIDFISYLNNFNYLQLLEIEYKYVDDKLQSIVSAFKDKRNVDSSEFLEMEMAAEFPILINITNISLTYLKSFKIDFAWSTSLKIKGDLPNSIKTIIVENIAEIQSMNYASIKDASLHIKAVGEFNISYENESTYLNLYNPITKNCFFNSNAISKLIPNKDIWKTAFLHLTMISNSYFETIDGMIYSPYSNINFRNHLKKYNGYEFSEVPLLTYSLKFHTILLSLITKNNMGYIIDIKDRSFSRNYEFKYDKKDYNGICSRDGYGDFDRFEGEDYLENNYVPYKLRKDSLNYFSKGFFKNIESIDKILKIIKNKPQLFSLLPQKFLNNEDLMVKVVLINPYLFSFASYRLRHNLNFVTSCIEKDLRILSLLDKNYIYIKEMVSTLNRVYLNDNWFDGVVNPIPYLIENNKFVDLKTISFNAKYIKLDAVLQAKLIQQYNNH